MLTSNYKDVNMENIFIRLQNIFNPHRLIPHEIYQNAYGLTVSLIRPTPDSSHSWHTVGDTTLTSGTFLLYRGSVKSNHLIGELEPKNLLFEITQTIPHLETDSPDQVRPTVGDLISVPPSSRPGFTPAPKS